MAFVKRIDFEKWQTEAKQEIQIATGLFVIGSVFMNIATWSVWGLLTPFILFITGMGLLSVASLFGR